MPNNSEIFLAKVETVYGVDAAPTPAADAHVIFNWNPTPLQYDQVRRKIDRPFPGRKPKLLTRRRQSHAFAVELAGSGTPNLPTRWGSVLLRGCMFDAPVPNGAIDVNYPLGSAGDGGSLTVWGAKGESANGGVARHRVQGFRSNAKFTFTEGDLPMIDFDGTGIPTQLPDGTAIAAPTLPVAPAPVEVNSVNTAFSLGGFAVLLRSLELDLGMKTAFRSLVGQRVVLFDEAEDGDRRSAGGRIVFELPDPTLRSFYADVDNRANLAMSLTHGITAGNIVELSTAGLQLDEPTYSVEQNRLMASCNFDLIPSAPGNEFTLKTR